MLSYEKKQTETLSSYLAIFTNCVETNDAQV